MNALDEICGTLGVPARVTFPA